MGDRRHHGMMEHRGFNEAARTPSGRVWSRRFANRFAELPPYDPGVAFLDRLGSVTVEDGELVGPMLGTPDEETDADVGAGIAFFGQFIDHEFTFDPTSMLDRRNDPKAVRNFRTPALDLDSLYGAGPEVRPFLYDSDDPDSAKLTTGPSAPADPTDESATRAARFGATDLQRNAQGDALIVDPRNDENIIISQLQLAFIKFHNRVVDYIRSGDGHARVAAEADGELDVFETAERLVRWHYQWLVLHEFLPRVCDQYVLEDILENGREYFIRPDHRPAIPIEFAAAAYRYGHSQIRDRYTVNSATADVEFFPGPAPEENPSMAMMMTEGGETVAGLPAGVMDAEADQHLNGFRPVPDALVVEWSYFFDYHPEADTDGDLQYSRPIDAQLPPALFLLPFIDEGPASLAARNLRRGASFGLPSGQALAEAMGIDPLANRALPLGDGESYQDFLASLNRGGDPNAPLWLYILAEADVHNDGDRLGALGSRIVGEVIYGLLEVDNQTFLTQQPDWRPTLPRSVTTADDDAPDTAAPYRFGDLLHFATGPTPDGLRIAEIDGDGSGTAPDTPTADPTNGEAVILEHTGTGELPIEGYRLDYEEQTARIDPDDETSEVPPLAPGDRFVVYTGDGPADDPPVRTYALGRGAAVINDAGETVAVSTPTGEVSAVATFTP